MRPLQFQFCLTRQKIRTSKKQAADLRAALRLVPFSRNGNIVRRDPLQTRTDQPLVILPKAPTQRRNDKDL